MLKILPIMIFSSAQKSYPLCSISCPWLLQLCPQFIHIFIIKHNYIAKCVPQKARPWASPHFLRQVTMSKLILTVKFSNMVNLIQPNGSPNVNCAMQPLKLENSSLQSMCKLSGRISKYFILTYDHLAIYLYAKTWWTIT